MDMFSEAMCKAGITYPQGFKAAGVKAGIKKSGNLDVAVIYTEKEAKVAGVFTQNAVAAAPVFASKKTVATGTAHAITANAGCANACTGEQGNKDAAAMQSITAEALGCEPLDVVVASTGIIGVNLPMEKMEAGIKQAVSELSVEGSETAGKAIITTDTYSKSCATEIELGGRQVRFGAIAKGSGMIQPNMATMLCFITTDAAIDQKLLQKALSEITEVSFNMISIDGDMSTNDMVVVLANGEAGNEEIKAEGEDYEKFKAALKEICQGLSPFADGKTIAMSVAKSPLVKTAFFGEDPNWGRVICAVGYAGVPMEPEKTVVKFGGIPVYAHGVGAEHDEEALKQVMSQKDIVIDIDMGLGEAEATVWTCDFSYEYVKINGEYHT